MGSLKETNAFLVHLICATETVTIKGVYIIINIIFLLRKRVVFNRCLAVWYPFCFSGQAVYPFTAIKPSSRSSSFFYLFCQLSLNPFSFFIRFLLRSVAVRSVRGNKIKWYYFAQIVTNIFAHEINVIKRRGQIKKELFFVGSVWDNICVNTDIGIKWQQLRGWSYWLKAISCFKKWYRCSESTTGDIIYLLTNHWNTELQCF